MLGRCILVAVALLFGLAPVHADVIVTTSIGAGLSITPITPTIGNPLYGDSISLYLVPGVYGAANTTAQDSLTPSPLSPSYGFNFSFDGPTSASSSTLLASASAAADGSVLTVSGQSGVNIPSLNQAAIDQDGNGQVTGFFEIADATNAGANPIGVTFTADLTVNQSLFTDPYGISASSETTYQLILDSGITSTSPYLFYDNPLSIGSNSTVETGALTPSLTNSATLNTNTQYFFFEEADAESSGVDSSPEPGTLWLMALAIPAIALHRLRLTKLK